MDDIQKDLNKEGLTKTSSKSIYKAMDKDKNIVASSNSMNGLASKLDISLAGLKYHLGRESYFYTKAFNLDVSITK